MGKEVGGSDGDALLGFDKAWEFSREGDSPPKRTFGMMDRCVYIIPSPDMQSEY